MNIHIENVHIYPSVDIYLAAEESAEAPAVTWGQYDDHTDWSDGDLVVDCTGDVAIWQGGFWQLPGSALSEDEDYMERPILFLGNVNDMIAAGGWA